MILIINNLTASPLSYLSGAVTVAASGSTMVSDQYKIALATDGALRQDCLTNIATVSDGTSTFGGNDAIIYLHLLLASLPSTGVNNSTAPVYSVQVAGQDNSGNLKPLKIDSTGAIYVNSTPAPNGTTVLAYNEITSIASGIETTIVSYTAPAGKDCFIQVIESSGTNMAEYRIYNVSTVFDKKYSSLTQFNVNSDYRTNESSSPGYKINSGNTVYVKVIHNRSVTGNFNSKIQIFEVG